MFEGEGRPRGEAETGSEMKEQVSPPWQRVHQQAQGTGRIKRCTGWPGASRKQTPLCVRHSLKPHSHSPTLWQSFEARSQI